MPFWVLTLYFKSISQQLRLVSKFLEYLSEVIFVFGFMFRETSSFIAFFASLRCNISCAKIVKDAVHIYETGPIACAFFYCLRFFLFDFFFRERAARSLSENKCN